MGKCFCTDPNQKPWPEGGTEFEKQLKKGHVKASKNGMCACRSLILLIFRILKLLVYESLRYMRP